MSVMYQGSKGPVAIDTMAYPHLKAALAKQGMDVVTDSTPARFADYMKQDLAKWTDVVKRAHVKVD